MKPVDLCTPRLQEADGLHAALLRAHEGPSDEDGARLDAPPRSCLRGRRPRTVKGTAP